MGQLKGAPCSEIASTTRHDRTGQDKQKKNRKRRTKMALTVQIHHRVRLAPFKVLISR